MTSLALAGQVVERRPLHVVGRFWDGRVLLVDLSDGGFLSLRWDETHAYTGIALHSDEHDEVGRDVVPENTGLPLSTVEMLVDDFTALREQAEEVS